MLPPPLKNYGKFCIKLTGLQTAVIIIWIYFSSHKAFISAQKKLRDPEFLQVQQMYVKVKLFTLSLIRPQIVYVKITTFPILIGHK